MNKWSEPVIYPWVEWANFLWKKFDDFLGYSHSRVNTVIAAVLFGSVLIPGIIILTPITILFGILQTIEYPIGVLINVTDKMVNKVNSKPLLTFILVPTIVLVFIIVFTWGLPRLIYMNTKKKQRERLAAKEAEYIQSVQQDYNRVRVVIKQKDFTPAKQIKQHRL